MTAKYKAVGGVERAILYPADAVEEALFSSCGCEVEIEGEGIEVELIDDSSYYEERTVTENGVVKIAHLLHLVGDREVAASWLDTTLLEQISIDGVVAVVYLGDGRCVLVGYSAQFGNEQPLRLKSLTSASGSTPAESPIVTLQLISHDTEFSQEIL